MTRTVVTLTGVTCSGKSTLEKVLLNNHGFGRVKSTTTRAPRANEIDGIDYDFVDYNKFVELSTAGKMVEYVQFGGALYGVSADNLQRAIDTSLTGNVVIVMEPEGAAQVRAYCTRHNIRLLQFWHSVPPGVQATRFIRRTLEDFKSKPSEGHRVQESYSRRLSEMLTTEQRWENRMVTAGAWPLDGTADPELSAQRILALINSP